MTKKEIQLIRRYAKAMNTDPKIVLRTYEHGDRVQREIDFIGMEATIYLRKAKKEGKISSDEKGNVNQEQMNELVKSFLATKKNVPQFFKQPLPIITKEKEVQPEGKTI